MDGDPPHWQQRLLSFYLIERLPAPELPSWAPPVVLKEGAALDALIVRFCEAGYGAGGWTVNRSAFYEVIRFVWLQRLPLTGLELWKVIGAHGVPDSFEHYLSDLFEHSRDLLVHIVGRRPFKNRRVKPLRP